MLNPREKQGYLGDLHSKSTTELLDLLQRQDSLLSKKKFIASMPDKGRKVNEFAEKLREILKSRDPSLVVANSSPGRSEKPAKIVSLESAAIQERETSRGFDKNAQDQTTNSVTRTIDEDISPLRKTQNTSPPHTATANENSIRESETEEVQSNEKNVQNLETQFTKMEIVSKEDKINERLQQEKSSNAFGKALAMSEQLPTHFQTNRSLKISGIQDLPEKYKPKVKSNKNRKWINLHDGDSAATPPVYKHNTSYLVSIDESIELQKQQKLKQEELQARTAAEKLAQRLNITMETYSPEGVDMSYRITEQEIDSDDDTE